MLLSDGMRSSTAAGLACAAAVKRNLRCLLQAGAAALGLDDAKGTPSSCPPCFPSHLVLSLQSAHCLPSSFPLHLRLSHLCGKTAVHEAHTTPTQDVQTHHCRMHGQQPLKKHARQACDLMPFCVTFAWQQLDACSAS